ncbi:hypothetical protein ABN763_04945 [Spongiivirga sp. MCCC 1A20706]|uniref:hypothetical protein n=1 Tax=Spongiivirga sp. MCCC 1A20706 TaxID=3160963 RepID=UPI003977CBDB
MKRYLLIILVLIVSVTKAQAVLDWSDLSDGIVFKTALTNTMLPEFRKATFVPDLKILDGKEVSITGYFLLIDTKQAVYLLSKNPMASCFFCGNGGLETVIDLSFEKKPSFEMDDLIIVKGIFRLNGDDPNKSYYRIENADAFSFN